MIALIVIILGGVSLNRLPIDLMPEITLPSLSVVVNYPNAGPEAVEGQVTTVVEQALSAVPGVQSISSTSSDSSSVVSVAFEWGTDLEAAANDIRDRLDRIMDDLPELATRPTLRKFDLAQFPILILGVISQLDPVETRQLVDEQLRYRLERIPGVAAIDIWGGFERETRVNVDPNKIKAIGLSLTEVINGIKRQNVAVPTGTIVKGDYELMVTTAGQYSSIDELANTVVATRDGQDIQLKEIAEIAIIRKKASRVIRINGKPGIRIALNKQSLANTVEVAKRVFDEVEKIRLDFPQLEIIALVDTSDYIQRSITNVGSIAMFGGLFAILVLLFFLRNIRSTLIISTAIPISIVATFAFMYFSGFTLNLMSLGGLAVGIGLIVDNSIVVLENIHRLRQQGHSANDAAIKGSEEVTSAIIASTLTTLVIFLPLIFVRGVAGIMFSQLAYVISFSLICALAVAIMVIPMLSSRWMTANNNETKAAPDRVSKGFSRFIATFFTSLEDHYISLLSRCIKYRKTTLLLVALIVGSSLFLIRWIGVEYMPSSDESEVRVYADMDVGTRLEIMDDVFNRIETIVREDTPEIQSTVTRLGSSRHSGGAHSGRMQITLKPLNQRNRSSAEIASDLRKKLTGIPGVSIRTREGQGLFIIRIVSGSDNERIQIDLRGYDLDRAAKIAEEAKALIEDISGVTDIRIRQQVGRPEERVIVNRERAAAMNLQVSDIANTLQTILSGTPAGKFRIVSNEYDIMVGVKDADQFSSQELLNMMVVNAKGQPIVLKNVVEIISRSAPVQISRKDQQRVISISVNISGRDMGSILTDIRDKLSNLVLPRDFTLVYSGEYETQQEAFRELLTAILLAIILVYMVMACLYESVRDPFIVLFSVPLAVVGVLLMLFLTGTTFNVQTFIGCIMLAGIVVNNAILLVDYINLLRRRDGLELTEAIIEGGRRRLRPILMTASTTILGMFPLSLGLMEGGETQASLARAVIGGLASSTLITLIVVPVVYSVVEKYVPMNNK